MKILNRNKQKKTIVTTLPPDEYYALTHKDKIAPLKIKFFPNYVACGTHVETYVTATFSTATRQTGLLATLSAQPGIFINISFKEANINKFYNDLNKTVSNTKGNAKGVIEEIVADVDVSNIADLVTEMRQQNEAVFHYTILIKVVAPNIETLNERLVQVEAAIGSLSAKADFLLLNQDQAYTSFLPFNNNKMEDIMLQNAQASALANLWLPDYNGLKHPEGILLGKTKQGGVVALDLFLRNKDLTNGNVIVIGESGQGKSFLIKKVILNAAIMGINVIICDPENEYSELVGNLDGKNLEIPRINPLQIRVFDEDEIKAMNEQVFGEQVDEHIGIGSTLSLHLSFVRKFFLTYKQWKEATHGNLLNALEYVITLTYAKFNIGRSTDFARLKPVDFPTFHDVYITCLEEIKKLTEAGNPRILDGEVVVWDADTLHKLSQELTTVSAGGSDNHLFNVKTDLPIYYSTTLPPICFNLKSLGSLATSTKSALYFNLFSYIWSLMSMDKNTKFTLFCDEFHTINDKDKDSPNYAVKMLSMINMRARKYEICTILGTTNFSEFTTGTSSEYSRSLIDNSSIKFLFKPGDKDFQEIVEVIPKLNDKERQILQQNTRGTCLALIGNQKCHLDVEKVDYEARLFGNAGGR